MTFSVSICDPLKPDIIELGSFEQEQIMVLFDRVPWTEYLAKMETAEAEGADIHFSPSFEIMNAENKHGLSISAVDATEWMVFFIRPKTVKRFFGLFKTAHENYMTDLRGQTEKDVRDCLEALLRNDVQYLEDKIK